ncbi:copper homeostasis periplasmic binding protein CopC [Pantoea allii]|uniref:copper homeostasis periplasmic binding protein CopC n=1 Tax=Pantoea allii TaxID=574096 RepID=UPI0015615222|nr:copper homeostasis periplasmic binding protein CopC [Pantoea allii]NQS85549.1 copper homeostasis periplasmic binding protein CopC [Pantoea allii]
MNKTAISRVVIGLVATGTLAFSQFALAHAHLQSSTPAANAAVSPAPQNITLTFTEDVEAAFSGVEVTNAQHKAVGEKARLDGQQHNRLLVDFVQPLAQGSYQVNWHVLSVDGHKTHGRYAFTVK